MQSPDAPHEHESSEAGPGEVPQISGLVDVTWWSGQIATGLDSMPRVFAELEVADAATGEPMAGTIAITIRCANDEYDGLARAEITELLDTDGRPYRNGATPTEQTATHTYLLAAPARPLDFAGALRQLRLGRRLARTGWNGAGMWILLVPGSTITVEAGRPLGRAAPELVGQSVGYSPHIDIRTAAGALVPWVASQSDLLATDWHLVPAPDGSEP